MKNNITHYIYGISKLMFAVAVVIFITACPGTKEENTFSVALVTDIGGIDDTSFNQGTWEGIVRFAESQGFSKDQYKYLQSSTDADYIPNLSTLADEGTTLIVAAGFLFESAITEVSKNFPDTQFLFIDMNLPHPNVASASFNEEEGSFLVGVIAALQSQAEGKTKIGFVGGMEFDVIHRFEAGFEAGMKAVAPEIELLVQYAGDFASPQIGQALAAKMYDAGASIVFVAAGATGNGAIKEAKDRALAGETVWVIGVDRDQYEDGIYSDEKSIILTSMIKRVDVASHDVVEMSYAGNFPGGETLNFSLANDGVGIPKENPNLSAEFLEKTTEYRKKVQSGEITVPRKPSRLQ